MIINEGASFGLSFPFLKLVSGLFLVLLFIIWCRDKKAWGILLMVLGGGLNLIERVRFGMVIDYWKIPTIPVYNNLNDYFIVSGVIQLIWYLLWKKRQK
jgi:lipoprotein signal peptidase